MGLVSSKLSWRLLNYNSGGVHFSSIQVCHTLYCLPTDAPLGHGFLTYGRKILYQLSLYLYQEALSPGWGVAALLKACNGEVRHSQGPSSSPSWDTPMSFSPFAPFATRPVLSAFVS